MGTPTTSTSPRGRDSTRGQDSTRGRTALPVGSRRAGQATRGAAAKTVAVFRVGSAAAAGLTPASDKAALAALLTLLNQLPALRAQVNGGTIPALTAFNRYNDTEQAVYPYINGSTDPQQSLPAYQEG